MASATSRSCASALPGTASWSLATCSYGWIPISRWPCTSTPTRPTRPMCRQALKVTSKTFKVKGESTTTHRRKHQGEKMSKRTSDNRDELFSPPPVQADLPAEIDRRTFFMRNAVIGAAAVMTGTTWSPEARAEQAAKEAQAKRSLPALDSSSMSPELDVVKRSKGPVMTVLEEFYKVGPGPSSSHTIGPMRITYDFYQRCTKLPAEQLKQATGLKVHLFGRLSATGKGHGTERAALAGLIGKEPATVDPLFLDEMRDKPDQSYALKLGDKTFSLSLADIIYDAPKGVFPHP